MTSRFFSTAADASSAQQRQGEALNNLLGQIRAEQALSEAPWEGFAFVLHGDGYDVGGRCRQVDAILYVPGEEPTHAHASRLALAPDAEVLFMAMADGRPFDQVVVAITYRRDTREMRTDLFWDEDADPYLVTPSTWHTIAAALDPFRP